MFLRLLLLIFFALVMHSTQAAPPVLQNRIPVDNGITFFVNGDLLLHFNEAIDIQTGNVYIKNALSDTTFETLDVTTAIGNGEANIYIPRTQQLIEEAEYYIEIDAGAFDDNLGNPYAGLTDNGEWSFTAMNEHANFAINGTAAVIDNSTINDPHELAAGDLDADGDMDLVAAIYGDNDIVWYENDGSQSFTKNTLNGNFTGAESVYVYDIDEDGDLDVLGAAETRDEISWWENDGTASFTQHIVDIALNGANTVRAYDIDGDGDIDIYGTGGVDNNIVWYSNDGSEVFTKNVARTGFAGASDVHAVDVDGDGDIDLAATAETANDLAWFSNDGSETFGVGDYVDTSLPGAKTVQAIDLDEDGDMDFVTSATAAADVTIWLNDGTDTVFVEDILLGSFTGAANARAADLDADGDIDVVGVAGLNAFVRTWLNDDSESFSNINRNNGAGNEGLVLTDLDSDGDLDIVVSNTTDDDIVWYGLYENGSDLTPGLFMFGGH